MRFHVPKNFAETPYLRESSTNSAVRRVFVDSNDSLLCSVAAYPQNAPKYLHRDDLAAQCKALATTFDMNIWTSTTIKCTSQDIETKEWTIKLQTFHGERVVRARQLVQATGVGSRFPYVPKLDNEESAYEGICMHSQHFKNGSLLKEKGVKVGSPKD